MTNKSSNNEINRIHKRALRVLLDDYGSTFEELLQKRGEHTIHTRSLQTLLVEVYKCLTSKNPSFLWDLFERRPTNYNLRIKDLVQLPSAKTVRYRLNSLRFRERILWNTLPDMIKSAKSDRQFKDWTGSTCCCLVCIYPVRKNNEIFRANNISRNTSLVNFQSVKILFKIFPRNNLFAS